MQAERKRRCAPDLKAIRVPGELLSCMQMDLAQQNFAAKDQASDLQFHPQFYSESFDRLCSAASWTPRAMAKEDVLALSLDDIIKRNRDSSKQQPKGGNARDEGGRRGRGAARRNGGAPRVAVVNTVQTKRSARDRRGGATGTFRDYDGTLHEVEHLSSSDGHLTHARHPPPPPPPPAGGGSPLRPLTTRQAYPALRLANGAPYSLLQIPAHQDKPPAPGRPVLDKDAVAAATFAALEGNAPWRHDKYEGQGPRRNVAQRGGGGGKQAVPGHKLCVAFGACVPLPSCAGVHARLLVFVLCHQDDTRLTVCAQSHQQSRR